MLIHVDQHIPSFFVGFEPDLGWEIDTSLMFEIIPFIKNQKDNPNFIRYMVSLDEGPLLNDHPKLMVEIKDETKLKGKAFFVIAYLTPIEAVESLRIPEFNIDDY